MSLLGGIFGYWPNQANLGSAPGTIPVGTPGERPRGANTTPAASGGAGLSPEPVAQEILAWRSWNVDQEEPGRLLSHNHTPWEGPVLVADKVPAPSTQNGIYALQKNAFFGSGFDDALVIGEVALSGIVIEGQSGFRAERAVIRALQVYFSRPSKYKNGGAFTLGWMQPEQYISFPHVNALDFLSRLEERYNCPVEVMQWPVAPAAPPSWHRVNMVRVVNSATTQHTEQYLEAWW